MITAMPSPISFLALPPELIEAILICSRSPCTVASIAHTCRKLHTLVYAMSDSHLWRGLFLSIWDDPRPALEHRAILDPRIDPTTWDWATEYRKRVSADRWLKAWRCDVCLPDALESEPPTSTAASTSTDAHSACQWRPTAQSALSVVLDTLLTLRPFPASPPITLTVVAPVASDSETPDLAGNAGSDAERRRERMRSAPQIPPLLIVLASGIGTCEVSKSGVRVGRMVFGPHATRTRVSAGSPGGSDADAGTGSALTTTASWALIPTPSLPPQLVRTLLASHAIGVHGLPAYTPFLSPAGHWGGDPLGDVFHRIVCITGFVPVPPPLSSISITTTTTTTTDSDNAGSASAGTLELGTSGDADGNDSESDEGPKRRSPKTFPTPLQQHVDARTLARRRVYDMQYLRGDRLWGPYHIVTRAPHDARPVASGPDVNRKGTRERQRVRHLGTLAWSMGVDVALDDVDSDSTSDDSNDEDWHDPAEPGQGTINVDIEPMEPERSLLSLILASTDPADPTYVDPVTNTTSTSPRRRIRRSNPHLPFSVSPREIKPHHLRPDYTYLASARIVVEANLRELFGYNLSDDVEESAPEVRPGVVGMFWEDEDEIWGKQGRSSDQASSLSSLHTVVPSSSSMDGTFSSTLDFTSILAQFKNLEVARLGSGCGYWGRWKERQRSAEGSVDRDVDASASPSESGTLTRKLKIVKERAELETSIEGCFTVRGKGKGKGPEIDSGLGSWEIGPEGEACQGWDWAGVAGIWKRCVCWMDYRELLFFNLDSSKFLTLDTQEACRIIPMELRITGYTRAGLIPVYDTDDRGNINVLRPDDERPDTCNCSGYFRPPPIIHFVGSSIGSDRGMDDSRKVKGNVQLIGGGEVRWQLDTYMKDSHLPVQSGPEWSSEAVQVGGIGSAVGLLGMWTGARHERADPLGPFWAWKVA